ncbi:uroplakin-3b-like [Rhineura floridana]|uniref:uroplakin-3b-like n=1 Tax=Rhineura floridana TaxID=261503 RepID=UPI002AC7EEF8|nr:uroplakin-3b-like [Rhineura floridana]
MPFSDRTRFPKLQVLGGRVHKKHAANELGRKRIFCLGGPLVTCTQDCERGCVWSPEHLPFLARRTIWRRLCLCKDGLFLSAPGCWEDHCRHSARLICPKEREVCLTQLGTTIPGGPPLLTRTHPYTTFKIKGPPEVIPYTPRVSDQSIEGKITGSTFVLEPPSCIFDPFVNASDNIWLVVTYVNATAKFKNPVTPQQIPPYEALYTTYGYMTMKSTISQYPCRKGKANVLRVGNESSCKNDDSRTSCNGPLPSHGPFRVKFLAMNSNGSKAETRWSAPITLTKVQAWKTVDTWPGRRSGDMIVITVILSALCGVVTIGFLSTVCYECFKLWRQGPPEENQEEPPRQEPFQASRYDTHHIPPAPPVPPPPPAMDMPSPQLISTSS